MLHANVAEGVHRIEDAFTNWYLIEADGRLTIVDAGVPSSWASLQDALRALGRSLDDIDAVVLTHAHFDHVGFAERARTTLGVPVHVHENDAPLTRHPWRYDHERPRSAYFATQVQALPIVAALLRHRRSGRRRSRRSSATRTASCPCRARRASCRRPATRSATARCTCPTATRSSPATRS